MPQFFIEKGFYFSLLHVRQTIDTRTGGELGLFMKAGIKLPAYLARCGRRVDSKKLALRAMESAPPRKGDSNQGKE